MLQKKKKIKHIGVIGTNATIESNIYAEKIKSYKNNVKVSSLATPLLANLIEEDNHQLFTKGILDSYLNNKILKDIDSLILGCTHYPLITKEINEYFNFKVEIINSIDHIKTKIKNSLKEKKALKSKSKNLQHQFYVSDYTENFQKKTELFFSSKILLEEVNIF